MEAVPRARENRRSPYTWVTWLTALLSGDASCWFAAWFKSHFTWQKVERGQDFDLASWKVRHNQMVDARKEQLKADGWLVTIEDQNSFTLKGTTGTLAGKPDIVALKEAEALVVDCKGGQRKASDIQQVLIYLYALPVARKQLFGKRLSGEVQYADGSVHITPEQFTPEIRMRIVQAMVSVSAATPLEAVPSARECAFCEIGAHDCPQRMDVAQAVVSVGDF